MVTQFDPVAYAKECIEEKVNETVPNNLVFATINMKQLMLITGMGRTTLEDKFIRTKEAKDLEVSITHKKLWLYPEIGEAWREFCKKNKRS